MLPSPADDSAQRRVTAARRCRAWVEIDGANLVRRPLRFYVDAASDAVYTPHTGDAFARDGKVVEDQVPVHFAVEDGDVRLYDLHAQKWSEILYERERAAGAR